MSKAAAQTGSGPITLVAMEQYFPKNERIIEDDLAERLLPSGTRFFLRLLRSRAVRNWMVQTVEREAPGIYAGMLCRKRYIDEKLIESLDRLEAVVNLGAGFDTRAYRLKPLSNLPVWEIDQPENIRLKQARVRKVFGEVPAHIKLVPTDFDREDIKAVLESHGYSKDRRTFFIWEAVTQYLTDEGIRTTFEFLAKAAQGSRLVFTYVRRGFLEGRDKYGWEKGYNDYVTGKVWLFGMEPEEWPGFLSKYGWRLIEDVGYDDLDERYVKPTGRKLTSTPIERIVFAEKR